MVDEGMRHRVIKDSIFNAVECDIKLTKEFENNDTISYSFDFYRLKNNNDRYRQPHNSYVGIGYLVKSGTYFPIHGTSFIEGDENFFNKFFAKKEKGLVEFLKTYKGYLAPWLKNEVQKRKILR